MAELDLGLIGDLPERKEGIKWYRFLPIHKIRVFTYANAQYQIKSEIVSWFLVLLKSMIGFVSQESVLFIVDLLSAVYSLQAISAQYSFGHYRFHNTIFIECVGFFS